MRRYLIFTILLLGFALIGSASAQDVAASELAASKITVAAYQVDPPVLMKGDTGIITVKIQNTGSESVALNWAKLYGKEIIPLDDPYDRVGTIGPANTINFTFHVRATKGDGVYYPEFALDFRDAGQMRYPIPVQIGNRELQISVLDQPADVVEGKKSQYQFLIGNPRGNEVNGVTVVPISEGCDITPSSYFLGALKPDASAIVSFNITPRRSDNVTLQVHYNNGINRHMTQISLPIALGDNRRQADPVLSNIQVTQSGGTYHVTGDIMNAGLETAKSIMISAGGAAVPVDPYKVYVVGALEPDDFSSFELSFSAQNISSIPLTVQYKDDDGNTFSTITQVEFSSRPSSEANEAFPITAVLLILAVVLIVGAVIFYSWRKA
jgi:hypothetical protein